MKAPRAVRVAATAGLAIAVVSITTIAAAMQFSSWGAAATVESVAGTSTEFNTAYLDGCPIQAPDGLSFYIASNRPGGMGGLDIWVAHRATEDGPWGAPQNLGTPVNSGADDFCPTPVRGNGLFFVSARAGGCGGPDIYFARLNPNHGWSTPANLGCQVNSSAGEAGPSFFETGERAVLYFSTTRPGGVTPEPGPSGDSDIYASALGGDGAFGPAVLVPGLNTAAEDARPNVRKDGLEIVFDSTRPGTMGGPDIYSAARVTVSDTWSVPVNLGPSVNTSSSESRASLSWDGLTLFFGSNRSGSELGPDGVTPSNDIYFTTREKITGNG